MELRFEMPTVLPEVSGAERAASVLGKGRISRSAAGKDASEAEVAAKEMESLFATLMVAELRKGLGEGFFGEGPGADTFNGWFDEQLGASLASRGSLGLGEQIKEAIVRETGARSEEQARKDREAETGELESAELLP